MIYIDEIPITFASLTIKRDPIFGLTEFYTIEHNTGLYVASFSELSAWSFSDQLDVHNGDVYHELCKVRERYLIDNNAHERIYDIINIQSLRVKSKYSLAFVAVQICQHKNRVADYHEYYYIMNNVACAFARHNGKWFIGNSICPNIIHKFSTRAQIGGPTPNIDDINEAYSIFWRPKITWYLNVLLWSHEVSFVKDIHNNIITICVTYIIIENNAILGKLYKRSQYIIKKE